MKNIDLRFIADDTGALTTQLGLLFDATALLGAPRSKVGSDI
jgi:peroxiredoxin